MKFLLDHQLPSALIPHIEKYGGSCVHVSAVGLEQKGDRVIWNYACENGYVIVSKDEDFVHLSQKDRTGTQLLWVRVGNCRTIRLISVIENTWSKIQELLESGERIVELR